MAVFVRASASGRGTKLRAAFPAVAPARDDSELAVGDIVPEFRSVENLAAFKALGSTANVNCGKSNEITGAASEAASPSAQTRCRTAADCRWSNLQASAASAIATVDLMTTPPKGKPIIARMHDGMSENAII